MHIAAAACYVLLYVALLYGCVQHVQHLIHLLMFCRCLEVFMRVAEPPLPGSSANVLTAVVSACHRSKRPSSIFPTSSHCQITPAVSSMHFLAAPVLVQAKWSTFADAVQGLVDGLAELVPQAMSMQ